MAWGGLRWARRQISLVEASDRPEICGEVLIYSSSHGIASVAEGLLPKTAS